MNKNFNYTKIQLSALVLLRLVIGWHFLYEGVAKLIQPHWTAVGYLMDSRGLLSGFYQYIAQNETLLYWSNIINIFALIAIGLSLIVGCLSKWSSIAGIALLFLYYFSHIPFIGADYMMPSEGNYLWLDKNIIEICALFVLLQFPTSQIIGMDRLFTKKSKKISHAR